MLGQRARLSDAPPPAQLRRLSDPSDTTDTSLASRPLAIRSRDGSRWLPTPDEQSHRQGHAMQQNPMTQPAQVHPMPEHKCSSAVCAVAKVFGTTELLESILCSLDTKDVLYLRRISKQWDTTVQSSPYLRLHFFTYPQWDRPPSEYQLLPLKLPGVIIQADEPIHLGQWIKVSMTSEAAKRICPEPKQRVRARSIFEGLRGGLGRSSNDAWPASSNTASVTGSLKYEDLKIVQPPLLGMQAYLEGHGAQAESSTMPMTSFAAMSLVAGASAQREPLPAVAKLSCDSGMTLGFLAETALELLGSRNSGPSDVTGMKVVFKAIISFCSTDASPRRGTRRNLRTVTRIG